MDFAISVPDAPEPALPVASPTPVPSPSAVSSARVADAPTTPESATAASGSAADSRRDRALAVPDPTPQGWLARLLHALLRLFRWKGPRR